MIDIELFAGGGGLALGLQEAGFHARYLFEIDQHSCATLIENSVRQGGILHGEVKRCDVRKVDWGDIREPVRLLAGGAPCQPFSLGGKHLADRDGRNLFPEVLRAARALRPLGLVLENVQGLARPSFRPYLDYILHQLEYPSIEPKADETWDDHHARILKHRASKSYKPEYHVAWKVLNAADFGVPQTRRRVFFVATRSDLLVRYTFPPSTHSREALVFDQKMGFYWKRHAIRPPKTLLSRQEISHRPLLLPWCTVRDGLKGLPPPSRDESTSTYNHWLIPGARLYTGHGGCNLDWPSKTIKAGVHGVPGGENILLLDDGSFRYFTLRETARLQGFPDNYFFVGARTHVTRQIGNAVPCTLAWAVAAPLYDLLNQQTNSAELTNDGVEYGQRKA
jgi:DNA (cytosine-5)-methyltransferase 1